MLCSILGLLTLVMLAMIGMAFLTDVEWVPRDFFQSWPSWLLTVVLAVVFVMCLRMKTKKR